MQERKVNQFAEGDISYFTNAGKGNESICNGAICNFSNAGKASESLCNGRYF